jgi:hypothetical protein
MRISVTGIPAAAENNAAWDELGTVLHDEVNRLPEKYRIPVILSHFEGMSYEEVAQLLDWPVAKVKRRLSRARDLLCSRLMSRGLVLSAAFLITAFSRRSVFTEVPPVPLVERTLQSAMRVRRRAIPRADALRSGTGVPTGFPIPPQT